MKTTTHFTLNRADIESLYHAAEVLTAISESFFNNPMKLYSAKDIENLYNICEGLDPIADPKCNTFASDLLRLKDLITTE